VVTDILKADLEALGRLVPQVGQLADQTPAHEPVTAGAGAPPSVLAARDMTNETLIGVRQRAAEHRETVAGLVERARHGFITTDEQLRAAIKHTPPL
jgi:hypothetical protein